ncbi:M20 family peptidase [Piscinibacter koreensis]|uniref:M20 family peptidase n=1 Tax=Piscinibacter koreensis TaxID=2742824 RepID=A0A7Y6NS79_9BURK|nr:M20 family peptidase [Schlegelella koreensis]
MRKFFWWLGAALLALLLAVGVRTLTMSSRQLTVPPVAPLAVDGAAAAARLAGAVRLQTISSPTDPTLNAAAFDALHRHLETSFPNAHAVLQREAVGHALVYTWPGSVAGAKPIALMAHQDVVPIAPGTERDWKEPPFAGVVKDGFIWGRGAWDDKGNLMAIMEAVDALARAGFKPPQTIYLVFGADEEVGGARGARAIAQMFKQRGVRFQLVLDEGLLITQGVLPGLKGPAAIVGVAEKGMLTLQLTATTAPGHSSMPPPGAGQSAIGMLAAALTRIENQPMPLAIRGLSRETFETLAPEMGGLSRVFLSNLWLFRPLVEMQLAKAASTNASLRTTTALTVFNAGNVENVLPGKATALVNFRVLPGDRIDDIVAHVTRAIDNPAIRVERYNVAAEASKVSPTDGPAWRLVNTTLRQLHPDVVVAPALMVAATDSRWFDDIADAVFRFSPVRATPEDLKRFHGTDERISVANYVELIQFFHQLITNTRDGAARTAQPGDTP